MKRTLKWSMRTALLSVCLFVVMATLAGPQSPLGSLALTPSDKLTHFLAFYVIALLAAVSFPSRRLLMSAVCTVTLGLSLEVLQGLTGREPSIKDALFNMAGIAMALVPFAAAHITQEPAEVPPARTPGSAGRGLPERSQNT